MYTSNINFYYGLVAFGKLWRNTDPDRLLTDYHLHLVAKQALVDIHEWAVRTGFKRIQLKADRSGYTYEHCLYSKTTIIHRRDRLDLSIQYPDLYNRSRGPMFTIYRRNRMQVWAVDVFERNILSMNTTLLGAGNDKQYLLNVLKMDHKW